MTEMTSLIDRYFTFWNETDPEARRALIAQTFTEDARYQAPLFDAEGHDGIDRMAQDAHDNLAGYRFQRTSEVDAHHDLFRVSWEVVPPQGQPRFAAGVNLGVVGADGRLQMVAAFLDQAPNHDGGHEAN